MNGLRNKNVLITGSSSGIGASIARKFAEYGANIGIHYSKKEKSAFELANELVKFSKIEIYQQDFSSNDLDLIDRFVNDFKTIDVLVNNAGIVSPISFLDMSIKDFDEIFNINSRAPFILSRDAFKHMKKNKFGRIINISSIAVKYGRGRNDCIQYAASKSTLETLTVGLAKMGAKFNILVNCIRPGVILTDIQKKRENLEERIKMIPVQRAGKVEEISNFVAYLASDKGNFITGQTFTISGGE